MIDLIGSMWLSENILRFVITENPNNVIVISSYQKINDNQPLCQYFRQWQNMILKPP